MSKICIHVCSKDRPTELTLLLQSIREQTFTDWELLILDDASGTPYNNFYFINLMVNKIKMDGHSVQWYRKEESQGVCYARNFAVKNDVSVSDFILRVDDDSILEKNYIECLMNVIENGFDVACGVVPNFGVPKWERDINFVKPLINDVIIDEDSNIITNGDDCGYTYNKYEILPTPHFRSNALYPRILHTNLLWLYPENVQYFREEQHMSFFMLQQGWNIGCNTGAIAWHLRTPSGGARQQSINEVINCDNITFEEWFKFENRNKPFLNEYRRVWKK